MVIQLMIVLTFLPELKNKSNSDTKLYQLNIKHIAQFQLALKLGLATVSLALKLGYPPYLKPNQR